MTYHDLHAPMIPAIAALLQARPAARERPWVLDLASGAGEKLGLIRAAYGPGARVIALDVDAGALHGLGPGALAADAHALPLADGSVDAAVCIAAFGLFARPALAARELRRVLRPGGAALVITAEQRWATVTRWPGALAGQVGAPLPQAHPDHAAPAQALAKSGGFARHHAYALAYALAPEPQAAALALLGWAEIAPLLAAPLPPDLAAACDLAQREAEIELIEVLLAAWLFRGAGAICNS